MSPCTAKYCKIIASNMYNPCVKLSAMEITHSRILYVTYLVIIMHYFVFHSAAQAVA